MKRPKAIVIRLSEEEKAIFETMAKEAGGLPVAQFVRAEIIARYYAERSKGSRREE